MAIQGAISIPLLLLLLCWQSVRVEGVYPWREGDASSSPSTLYEDRQEEILQTLRRNMRLVALEDTFAQSLTAQTDNNTAGASDESERVLFVKNVVGKTFVVRNAVDVNSTKNSGVIDSYFEDIRAARYSVETLTRLLTNVCGLYHVDYWTYEWCHRVRMGQFHFEPTENGFSKSPDWSLGNYSRTVVIRHNGDYLNDSAPIIKVIDYFMDGQRCDETNRGRHTEVHIQCCEGMALQNYIPVADYANHLEQQRQQNGGMDPSSPANQRMPPATLNAVTETKTCSYKATVCTPLLCREDIFAESKGSKKTANASKKNKSTDQLYLDVMKTISSTCVMRTEEWWTYEICFGKMARQVHYQTEQVVMPDGQLISKQSLASEYTLGLPLVSTYTNITEIQDLIRPTSVQSGIESITSLAELSRVSKAKDSVSISEKENEIIRSGGLVSPLLRKRLQKEPLHMLLEFNNGSSDLCHEQVKRAILAELSCGPSNTIKSIFELSTCNYIIKIDLLVLCKLDGFSQSKDKISVVQFDPYFITPEERLESEEEELEEAEAGTVAQGPTTTTNPPTLLTTTTTAAPKIILSPRMKMDKSGPSFKEATIDAAGEILAEAPAVSNAVPSNSIENDDNGDDDGGDDDGDEGENEEMSDIFNNVNQLIQ